MVIISFICICIFYVELTMELENILLICYLCIVWIPFIFILIMSYFKNKYNKKKFIENLREDEELCFCGGGIIPGNMMSWYQHGVCPICLGEGKIKKGGINVNTRSNNGP